MPLARSPAVTVVVFLVALEHARTTAFAARGTSLGPSHGSGGCGLVDEHEAVRIDIRLALEPDLVGRLHILTRRHGQCLWDGPPLAEPLVACCSLGRIEGSGWHRVQSPCWVAISAKTALG